jgi:hypothetical protein
MKTILLTASLFLLIGSHPASEKEEIFDPANL